jgi:hypothetical protein
MNSVIVIAVLVATLPLMAGGKKTPPASNLLKPGIYEWNYTMVERSFEGDHAEVEKHWEVYLIIDKKGRYALVREYYVGQGTHYLSFNNGQVVKNARGFLTLKAPDTSSCKRVDELNQWKGGVAFRVVYSGRNPEQNLNIVVLQGEKLGYFLPFDEIDFIYYPSNKLAYMTTAKAIESKSAASSYACFAPGMFGGLIDEMSRDPAVMQMPTVKNSKISPTKALFDPYW